MIISVTYCKLNISHSSLSSCAVFEGITIVKQLRITFNRLITSVWQSVCVCVCVCVGLILQTYDFKCSLSWFDHTVSLVTVRQQRVFSASFMCNIWLLLQLLWVVCLWWVQQLFTCAFSVNIPVDLCLYLVSILILFKKKNIYIIIFHFHQYLYLHLFLRFLSLWVFLFSSSSLSL